ncbi:MAG: hypothetical protein LAT75_06270 [Candidatus Cyclonatronum sp.]|uniref:hypothetical protein n=1 Tax=Cyclonatronum sp. TaxID=3024185 RepID=UPI0025BD4375|nr:hypothetical protein [Cyclonatronum sp.]MCH8486452.1 hypothetical protein [Cyclonatronum sp.]
MITISILKNKLSGKTQFYMSLITGAMLIIWFFSMDGGILFYQLLVTAAVLANLMWQIYRLRKGSSVSEPAAS